MAIFYSAKVSDSEVLCCKKDFTAEGESPLIITAYNIFEIRRNSLTMSMKQKIYCVVEQALDIIMADQSYLKGPIYEKSIQLAAD